jgi:hypothetical protein
VLLSLLGQLFSSLPLFLLDFLLLTVSPGYISLLQDPTGERKVER